LSYTLLVIEKSDHILDEVTVSSLTKEGFRVTAYSDHLEALLRLDELKPDLIILGEGLPVDSFEACRQLRQALNIPILMVGKLSRAEGWVEAVAAGADLYLRTPINYSELVARMKSILRRYHWTLAEGKLG
jgi:DNA-binding response OmpR family regulator